MTTPTLVAGIDSSTQSCKVVIREAESGALVRSGSAPHPAGTQVDPQEWWHALEVAVEQAGGLVDVAAVSVGGQQHGMVTLDESGTPIRPAMLWNDSSSGQAAADLVDELGAERWAEATGTVPVASITATKLRWLAEHEPENAARVAAVCLPHDYLTWRLRGSSALEDLVTDASDASGTGYYSPRTRTYDTDLLRHAFGRADLMLPGSRVPPRRWANSTPSAHVRCWDPVPATTPRPRSPSASGRVMSCCPWAPRAWSAPSCPIRWPTSPAPSPDSPTPPGTTSRWSPP